MERLINRQITDNCEPIGLHDTIGLHPNTDNSINSVHSNDDQINI